MNLNNKLKNVKVRCINLVSRKDKRRIAKKHLKKRGIKYELYKAEKHNNPKRGCLESHLNVIEEAIANKNKYLLIFEDDVLLIKQFKNIPEPPEDWDMLYFGGTVHRILSKEHENWTRVKTWTTHAYMINLKNKKLLEVIKKARDYDDEIDKYYMEKVHTSFKCYMLTPMIAIQRSGFSDIEGKMVSYDFMEKTLQGFLVPEHEIVDDNYVLKLPNIPEDKLPSITIVTPTYNRRNIFSLALYNFNHFIYPKNKIEWIIVDDTPEDMDQLDDIIPVDDPRIRYLKIADIDTKLTVAHKRNIGAQRAKNEIIVHMDDDDYYPPHSLLSRVKCLIKYKSKGIECVGCTLLGTYDVFTGACGTSSDGPISLSEASMAYTKKFWMERGFDSECER